MLTSAHPVPKYAHPSSAFVNAQRLRRLLDDHFTLFASSHLFSIYSSLSHPRIAPSQPTPFCASSPKQYATLCHSPLRLQDATESEVRMRQSRKDVPAPFRRLVL